MSTFSQQFMPYQLWRYIRMNIKIYLLAKGSIGPSHLSKVEHTKA